MSRRSSIEKQSTNPRAKYSQFSLFTILMSYKVAVNTDLDNTKPLLLGEIQGQVPAGL